MGKNQQTATGKEPGRLHRIWIYVSQHWQLYLFFLGPALILTLIFRYGPMGGIMIAFQKYNPIKGIMGSKWVGLKYFKQFLSDFGLHGVAEYESLSPEEKKITDRAYLKDLPNLIKKY